MTAGRCCETGILAALLLLSGCTNDSPRRDLASGLSNTASLAAETELFANYLQAGKSTEPYARTHIDFLEKQLDDETHTLNRIPPDARLQPALTMCRRQQQLLHQILERLSSQPKDNRMAVEITIELRNIRRACAEARAGL